MTTTSERETHLVWDYEARVVAVFTTEQGVVNRINKRLANTQYSPVWKGAPGSNYQTRISFDAVRDPSLAFSLLDPERERGKFPSQS